MGIGLIIHYYTDGNPTHEDDWLIYCKTVGEECGHNVWPVGINQVTNDQTIHLFPNPVLNSLTIVTPFDTLSVIISDAVGKVIKSEKCNGGNLVFDLSNIPPGLYFARINGIEVRKFVKE
ncbi:T9SS type A sorting domain-containing protein [Flavipsychrobacter stenotrophus]|uniref:T9SS type A sorting domain-containing protein n=1 Tax=Flavipsychrobacter stenotrophus TaxID=2077091 RepID=UPI00137514B6|nr:T9SS type A sorting domain-containing protein [Flavipsychrobacter stenotrophus]